MPRRARDRRRVQSPRPLCLNASLVLGLLLLVLLLWLGLLLLVPLGS